MPIWDFNTNIWYLVPYFGYSDYILGIWYIVEYLESNWATRVQGSSLFGTDRDQRSAPASNLAYGIV